MKRIFFFPILLAVVLLTSPVIALEPVVTKLHGRSDTDQIDNQFGAAVATSEKWIVVGEPYNNDVEDDAGAAHVFSATTGRYLRKLVGNEIADGFEFGFSVAVCGDIAVVGAPGDNASGVASGAVYVFNLRNGRQLLRVEPETPMAGQQYGRSVAVGHDRILIGSPLPTNTPGTAYVVDLDTGDELAALSASNESTGARFGWSVALCGNFGLVGAPVGDSDTSFNTGSAYLFDLETGNELYVLGAAVPSASAGFGSSVSLGSGYAVIGAPRDNEAGSEAGAAYVFDMIGGTELRKLIPNQAYQTWRFGNSVSISGAMVLIGEYYSSFPEDPELAAQNIGTALLFDLETGAEIRRFKARDWDYGDEFGYAVALCGDNAVIGAPFDNDLGADSGSVYFHRNLSSSRPFLTLAKVGDYAPGAPEADYRYFGQPIWQQGPSPTFEAGLKGPGSNGNRDKGVWADLHGRFKLLQSRDDLSDLGQEWDGISINQLVGLTSTSIYTVPTVTLKGPGVTAKNNRAVMSYYPSFATQVFARTGDSPGVLNGGEFSAFQDVSGFFANSGVLIPCLLRNGVGGVTASSNSGLFSTGNGGDRHVREGEDFDGSILRQTFGRVATHPAAAVAKFGAYCIPEGETTSHQGIFDYFYLSGSPGVDGLLVAQDDPGDINQDQTFRSFLGESQSNSGTGVIKATLKGPGVNGSNNEGLWFLNAGGATSAIREGDEIDPVDLPGVVLSRALKYWSVPGGAVAHVLLRGPGVNGANNGALIHVAEHGMGNNIRLILREGDPVCDWDCPRIGVIQRVEVERASRKYAVVVSLTGSRARNQALLSGNLAPADPVLWAPSLKLRKGTLYQAAGGYTTRLRSIDFRPFIERTGSGANGGEQVLSTGGNAMACLRFDNGVKEMVSIRLLDLSQSTGS